MGSLWLLQLDAKLLSKAENNWEQVALLYRLKTSWQLRWRISSAVQMIKTQVCGRDNPVFTFMHKRNWSILDPCSIGTAGMQWQLPASPKILKCKKNKQTSDLRKQKTWWWSFFILKKIYGHSNPNQENTQDCSMCYENIKFVQQAKTQIMIPRWTFIFTINLKQAKKKKFMCIHLRHLKIIDLPKLCNPSTKL